MLPQSLFSSPNWLVASSTSAHSPASIRPVSAGGGGSCDVAGSSEVEGGGSDVETVSSTVLPGTADVAVEGEADFSDDPPLSAPTIIRPTKAATTQLMTWNLVERPRNQR